MDEQQLSEARQQAFSRTVARMAAEAALDGGGQRRRLSGILHDECAALGILPGRDRGLVVTWGLAQFGLGS